MRKILCVMFILAILSTTAFAADRLTFSGELTVNGEEISGSGSITMPRPRKFETQDDDPEVMAGLFKEEGYDKAKAALRIETSEAFTVSGSRVNGVYVIQSGTLRELGNQVPAVKGDYYIGINNTPEEEEEIDEAAILQYIKISVVKSSGSNNNSGSNSDRQRTRPNRTNKSRRRYPLNGICTGDNVRLRSGPGTDSRVIDRADTDDELTIVGEEKDDNGETWYRIENPSGEGRRLWISGRYVEILDE